MAGVFRAAGGDDHLGTLADTGIGCLCNERSMARGSGAFSRIHTDTKHFLMESVTTGSFLGEDEQVFVVFQLQFALVLVLLHFLGL